MSLQAIRALVTRGSQAKLILYQAKAGAFGFELLLNDMRDHSRRHGGQVQIVRMLSSACDVLRWRMVQYRVRNLWLIPKLIGFVDPVQCHGPYRVCGGIINLIENS